MYDAVLLSHEKNGILPFVMSWMGLENIMLSERSQMENVKNRMISLMQDIKLKATKTNTDANNRMVLIRGIRGSDIRGNGGRFGLRW